MFTMLRAVSNFNKTSKYRIEKVLCLGLGTATGRVPLKETARQMSIAYKHFMHPTTNRTWSNLKLRNQKILGEK